MDQSSNFRPLLQESSDDSGDEGFLQQSHNGQIIGGTTDDDDVAVLSGDPHDNGDLETNLSTELIKGQSTPKDRYSFNYIIFYLLGMTTLLPWNFFITASDVRKDLLFIITLCHRIY